MIKTVPQIHTKFGTPVTIIGPIREGYVMIRFDDDSGREPREAHILDLRAPGGMDDIRAIAAQCEASA